MLTYIKKLMVIVMVMGISHNAMGMNGPALEAPRAIGASLSIQDLIDRNELPEPIEGEVIDLGSKGLTSLDGLQNIPNPNQITYLYLEDNKINHIPDHIFDAFPNLSNLNLTGNPLVRLQPNLFERLINLEELYLARIGLVEMPPHALDSLRKLKVLHLFDNKLESLPKGLIDNNTELEELDLQINNIKVLDRDFLKYQEKLARFGINHNKLSEIPRISHLKKKIEQENEQGEPEYESILKQIYIAKNKDLEMLSDDTIAFILEYKIGCDRPELLGEIPPYSIGQLIADLGDDWEIKLIKVDPITGEQTLNLDNRGLTDLSDLPGPMDLINGVSAKSNYIHRIPYEFFWYDDEGSDTARFPILTHLNLSNNMIETVSSFSPQAIGCQLTKLVLSNNFIKTLQSRTFKSMRKLAKLSLEINNIHKIEDGAFAGLHKLKHLNLGDNNLHVLPKNIFKDLQSLQKIFLARNSLGSISQYAFPKQAVVSFYPQQTPMTKFLVGKKIADGFEKKNLIAIYKELHNMPDEMIEILLEAASKKSAIKISKVLTIRELIRGLDRAQEKNKINIPLIKTTFKYMTKDSQETLLAVAPHNLRAILIQVGAGAVTPGEPSKRKVVITDEEESE